MANNDARRLLFFKWAEANGVDSTLHEEWNKFDSILSLRDAEVALLTAQRDELYEAAKKSGHDDKSNTACPICTAVTRIEVEL